MECYSIAVNVIGWDPNNFLNQIQLNSVRSLKKFNEFSISVLKGLLCCIEWNEIKWDPTELLNWLQLNSID